MNFSDALYLLRQKYKLRRKEWRENEYLFIERKCDIYLKNANGETVKWEPSHKDIFAGDWYVCE